MSVALLEFMHLHLFMVVILQLCLFHQPSGAQAFLDAHVHVTEPSTRSSTKRLNKFFARGFAEKAIVISPTYLYDPQNKMLNTAEIAHQTDVDTSHLLEKFPGKTVGLCGFRAKSEGAAENLRHCLALPRMKGVKMHLDWIPRDDDVQTFGREIEALASVLADRPETRMVLIHMPADTWDGGKVHEKDAKILAKFTLTVKKFPHVQWVIAHSYYSAELVSYLAEAKLSNLWIEISYFRDVLANSDHDDQERLLPFIDSWRKFGIHRILYGSDQLLGDDIDFESADRIAFDKFEGALEAREDFKTLPLSTNERKLLLQTNGQQFWKLVNH